tara:strand:- start:2252 stop:2443 length:192 start_codon:yes stop_codon:yes gene_type:complete
VATEALLLEHQPKLALTVAGAQGPKTIPEMPEETEMLELSESFGAKEELSLPQTPIKPQAMAM